MVTCSLHPHHRFSSMTPDGLCPVDAGGVLVSERPSQRVPHPFPILQDLTPVRTQMTLAGAYARTGDTEKALALGEALSEPERTEFHLHLIRVLAETDYDQAIKRISAYPDAIFRFRALVNMMPVVTRFETEKQSSHADKIRLALKDLDDDHYAQAMEELLDHLLVFPEFVISPFMHANGTFIPYLAQFTRDPEVRFRLLCKATALQCKSNLSTSLEAKYSISRLMQAVFDTPMEHVYERIRWMSFLLRECVSSLPSHSVVDPQNFLKKAISMLQEPTDFPEPEQIADIVENLAALDISEGERRILHTVARNLPFPWRDQTLARLVSQLADRKRMDEALTVVSDIQDPILRAQTLLTLFPLLKNHPAYILIYTQILRLARTVDGEQRFQILARYCEELPEVFVLSYVSSARGRQEWKLNLDEEFISDQDLSAKLYTVSLLSFTEPKQDQEEESGTQKDEHVNLQNLPRYVNVIPDPVHRLRARVNLAVSCLMQGYSKEARSLLHEAFEERSDTDLTQEDLASLAIAGVLTGMVEEGTNLLPELEDQPVKPIQTFTRSVIASLLVKKGEVERARQILED